MDTGAFCFSADLDLAPAGIPRLANTLVVLLVPELFSWYPDTIDDIRTTIRGAQGEVRLLARVARGAGLELALRLAAEGLPIEILLAPDVTWPVQAPVGLDFVRAPSGTTPAMLDEFALALSDVILTDPRSRSAPELVEKFNNRDRPVVPAGGALPRLPVAGPDLAGWLDVERLRWRRGLRHWCGRTEQFFSELVALHWRGARRSLARMHRCVARGWARHQIAYFAPEDRDRPEMNWRMAALDLAAIDDDVPIVARFNALDLSALHGSFLHRDTIWLAYLASAAAVFVAVFGSLHLWPFGAPGSVGWTALEAVILVGILLIFLLQWRSELQDHWTSCRFAAEQLRVARLCLPLLVVPWALRGTDMPQPDAFTARALNEVKRAVRDQGLPRLRPETGESVAESIRWLRLIITDQAGYHERNVERLERTDRNLHSLASVSFLFALGAVAGHLDGADAGWLLVFTAAFPAFAAAVHGVKTRLGIVHRIALSRQTQARLRSIDASLQRIDPVPRERAWADLRRLALDASDAMGTENASWHSLVRREKDDV
jgi:hypothetical protein